MPRPYLALTLLLLAPVRPSAAQDLLAQARAMQQRGHLDSAYTVIQQAAEAEPNRAEVQYALGDIAGNRAQQIGGLGAYGPARKCKAGYARAVQLEPDNPQYLEGLIGYLSQAPGIVGGDRDSAVALARHLMGIDERRGVSAMASALLRGNDREKARADSLMEAYTARHSDRNAQLNLGGYYLGRGQPEKALAVAERVLTRDQNDVLAKFAVGRALVVNKKDQPRAIGLLRQVIAAPAPTPGPGIPVFAPGAPQWRMGQAFVQLGLLDSARAAFQQALHANPLLRQAQLSLDSLTHH